MRFSRLLLSVLIVSPILRANALGAEPSPKIASPKRATSTAGGSKPSSAKSASAKPTAAKPKTSGSTRLTKSSSRAAAEAEYQRKLATAADTVAGQWDLAEWCRTHTLNDRRQVHLKRILELDPDHLLSRRALGYRKLDGQWATQEEIMTGRGYVLHKGKWLLPQEIKQLESKQKITASEKQWIQNLKRWRGWLDDERSGEALAKIKAINDPFALKALTREFADEQDTRLRMTYMQAIHQIGTPEAIQALVEYSLDDPLDEVRLTAIEYLAEKKFPEVTARYIQSLRSKDNTIINRAAIGLSYMENGAAVPALIDALVSTHEFQLVQGSPGISSTFASPNAPPGANAGGIPATPALGGISMGQTITTVQQEFKNAAVRDALIKLTGANFDFDVASWKAWLATRKKGESMDARRG